MRRGPGEGGPSSPIIPRQPCPRRLPPARRRQLGAAGRAARSLSAWSKAIANGHALAAVAGTDALRDAATRIFSTGSFWAGGVAMAAALATLTVADRDEGLIAHLQRMGSRLRQGIAEQAAAHGVKLRQSGPVQMPLILFDDDPQLRERHRVLRGGAAARGVPASAAQHVLVRGAWGEGDRSGVGGDGRSV